ncbi:acetyl-CoA synthetase-like protein [Periconia macrospinosa]|uniref:Acetyl-CoA synthetase-like protein n=1 Tax=Periconia macrospinosa TaxID=97972 RepID=A0A2V1D1E9_9PLEO|nr:acetyl-CoA synthetase-like protein [Periconia macrospinosa]
MVPNYGSRLLPVVLDEIAEQQPDLIYARIPLTTNISDGFKAVTFADIASATNYVAAWIESTYGRSTNFSTIVYMGVSDLRYVVVFLAAVKCGYKILLPSMRNSAWMNASLIEQTEGSILLYAPEVEALVKPLLDYRPGLQLHPIQPLETLIHPNSPPYPYQKTYAEAQWDPVLILHSSGSTGAPRPIQMYNATFAVADNDRNLPQLPGRINQNWSLWDFPQKSHFFSSFPPFHLAGFSAMVFLPIYYTNSTPVLLPPGRPPTGHLVSELMDHFPLKCIFCPPITAEQLVQEPDGLKKCNNLNFILYGGGPLSQDAGDALSKVTDVCQFFGQTETGALHALVPRRENWASLEWHPVQETVMEPSVDGAFEMVFHRNPDLIGYRAVSCNFPDMEVYRTKDLFKPVPDKPGLWRFYGRADDIIVLSNGEKFNPVPSEISIGAHPLVAGALVIGDGYPQATLVLELKDPSQDHTEVLREVWPTVEKANAEAPAHAKITRDKVVVASKDHDFERSPKGTIVRRATGRKFEEQVAKLFLENVLDNSSGLTLNPPYDLAAFRQLVSDAVSIAFKGHSVDGTDDFFVLGLDSLQTTEIITSVKSGILSGKPDHNVSWITPKLVYEHPSITSLSTALHSHLTSQTNNHKPHGPETPEARTNRLTSTVKKYTSLLPKTTTTQQTPTLHHPQTTTNLHVLLTGSTGSLGTQILLQLTSNPRVSTITCLDRSPNALDRITSSLSTWTHPPPTLPFTSNISFHQADYADPNLGLDAKTFTELRNTVNVIIHNAWTVDFNHALSSFEPVHLNGVLNLIHFSASSRLRPRIAFVSSISSVGNWFSTLQSQTQSPPRRTDSPISPTTHPDKRLIPEAIPASPAAALPFGYAESKAVAERVLADAARREPAMIPVSILRVGQIAGPKSTDNGATWNEHEWFPLLVKTAKAMGKMPEGGMADVDWVPVDVAAQAVVELSLIPTSSQPSCSSSSSDECDDALQVYHILNPNPIPWSAFLSSLLPLISPSSPFSTVPLVDWVAALSEVDAHDAQAVAAAPAVKILDFFRGIAGAGGSGVSLSTEKAVGRSEALREVGGVKGEWVERWMRAWGV